MSVTYLLLITMNNNNNNNTNNRVSTTFTANTKVVGLVIKHDLQNIRSKVKRGIFIRFADQRANQDEWYLEAYNQDTLDHATALIKRAEHHYSTPRTPRKLQQQPKPIIHNNPFDHLDHIQQQKLHKKTIKKTFKEEFPSLSPSYTSPPSTPTWNIQKPPSTPPPAPIKTMKKLSIKSQDWDTDDWEIPSIPLILNDDEEKQWGWQAQQGAY